MSRRLTRSLVAAGCIAVVLGGSVSLAAVNNRRNNSINGCVAKSNGAARITTHCKGSEKPISWSRTAVRGKPGRSGADGNAAGTLTYSGGATNTKTEPTATFGSWTLLASCLSGADGLYGEVQIEQKHGVKGKSTLEKYVEYTEAEGTPTPQHTPFNAIIAFGSKPTTIDDTGSNDDVVRNVVTMSLHTEGGKVATYNLSVYVDNKSTSPSCTFSGKAVTTS